MDKVLDWVLIESDFEIQSRYLVHFRINIFGKRIEPSYPAYYKLDSITAVLQMMDLALNNPLRLIFYQTKKSNHSS